MAKFNQEFYAPQNYEATVKRAWHNLSTKVSFTPQLGLNDIAYCRRLYKGDDFKINTASLIQTINPLTRPLLDCFELRLEYYFEPLSNLYGYLDNNSKESTEDIVSKSPKWTAALFGTANGELSTRKGILGSGLVQVDGDTASNADIYPVPVGSSITLSQASAGIIQKNSLLEAIGMPAYFQGVNGKDYEDSSWDNLGFEKFMGNIINIEPLLVYLDIMRTYHINQQFNKVLVSQGFHFMHSFDDPIPGQFDYFDLFTDGIWLNPQELDDLFVDLRYHSRHRDQDLMLTYDNMVFPNWRKKLSEWIRLCSYPYGGMFPCQYKPDLWRNILSESVGTVKSFVNVVDGQVSIDEFRQKNKLQRWIDALDLSGGRYKNILRTVFGGDAPRQLDIPQLLAVSKHLIDPSNITALAESTDVNLGQMGAKIDNFNNSREVRVRADQDGYLMVICNITPLVTYSQGINYNLLRLSMNDDYNPNFQRLGFQNVPKALYNPLPDIYDYFHNGNIDTWPALTEIDTSVSVGKQIAWIHEITDTNHCRGEFSANGGLYKDMVLNRKYLQAWENKEIPIGEKTAIVQQFMLNPYVNPFENFDIFAMEGDFTSPWSLHLAFNIQAKRPIGKRYRPNLE